MPGRPFHIYIYDPGHFTPYYNAGLCREFAAMGFDCTLLTSPATFERVEPGSYQVAYLFFGFLLGPMYPFLRHRRRLRYILKALCYPAGVWHTYQVLKRREPGVFHIHTAILPPLDALLAKALHRRGWRVVYTLQEPHPRDAWSRWKYGRLFETCDYIVMHGEQLAERLRAMFPRSAGKIASLRHGMDLPELASESERERARQELGVLPGEHLLLFFGMIKPYKGLEGLLDAMPAVLACMPNTRLCVVGEPLMAMEGIMQKVAALPAERVILRLGFLPQGEVGRYFAAADLVVACYREVPASSVVLQAQAHARPVLVTPVGALPAHVDEGRCGFIVEDNLAQSIVDALANPERLAEIGRRGRERVKAQCSWDLVAEDTLRFYPIREAEDVAQPR